MRILTVGGSLPGIEHNSAEWTDRVNIKDYDAVFLNLDKIVELAQDVPGPTSDVSHRIRFPPREDVKKSLEAGNHIFLFLPRTRQPELLHVTKDETQSGEIDILSWLPFNISTTEEPGTSVEEDSVPDYWKWYFGSDFDWPMYIEYVSIREESQQNLFDTVVQNTIASTTFEEDIACKLSIKSGQDVISTLTGEEKIEHQYSGTLSLLPIKSGWKFESVVRGILSHLYDRSIEVEQTPEPDWVDQYWLPEQTELANEIKKLRRKYRQLDEFNRLLYTNGDELEKTVLQAFEYLEFQTEEEIPGQRDGLVHLDSHVFALEIEGTINHIGIRKCRQLKNWVENAQDEYEDKEVHGLLVANAHRDTEPSNRDASVAGDPRKFLEKHGYKVLETSELHSILSQYQEGNLTTQDIENLLICDDLFLKIT